MSASREKMKRKTERENGVQEKKKMEVSPQLFRNLITVLCVIAVLAAVGAAIFGQGVPQQYMTAAAVEGQPVSIAEFNYHYYNSVQTFYNTYYSYFSYFGIDADKPLYKQKSGEGNETWHDYLVSDTMSKIKETVHFSELAKKEGVTLTTEDIETIEATMESVKNSAAAAGISEEKYVKTLFGRGVTPENLRVAVEREVLALRYEKIMNESFTYTDDQVSGYYEENKNNFDRVTYRSFSAYKTLSDEEYDALEAEGADLEEVVETPFGTMTSETKIAYDAANKLADTAGIDSFNELARELAPEDDKEYYDDGDYTLTEEAPYSDSDIYNWLFDTAREHGDITVIESETDFTTVMFIERVVDDYKTVTTRQIFVRPSSSSSSGDYTEAEWEEARENAQSILDKFVNAGAKEDDFTALVKDSSQDTSTKFGGGLYKETGKGAMGSDEIDEWMFDPARASGDCALVKSEYGYHVIYFVDYGRPYKLVQAENTMRSSDYNTLRSEKLADAGEPAKDWLGMLFVAKA